MKKGILSIFLLLISQLILAQSLSPSKQKLIDIKKVQLAEATKNNELIEICSYNKEIAEIYRKARINKLAVPYYQAAVKVAKVKGNSSLLRILDLNLSNVYGQMRQYGKAIAPLEEANKIGEKLQLGKKILYSEQLRISSLYRLDGQIKKALTILKPLYNKILFQAYDDNLLNECIDELIISAKKADDDKTLVKFSKIKDSRKFKQKEQEYYKKTQVLTNVVSQSYKAIKEKDLQLNAKQRILLRARDSLRNAEEAKKRSALKLQIKNSELKLKEAELEREKFTTTVLIYGLLSSLIVLGIITFLGLQLRKKNAELKLKNAEIFQQKEEIQTINDDLKVKNEQIENQHRQLTSAVTYAKHIQEATLPIEKVVKKYFNIVNVYLPKDIVSGDFYWYAEKRLPKNNHLVHFYAAVDCTGHGVPGAFMSMIGNRLLNEIIYQKNILNPKDILQALNIELQLALNQSENDNDDGMDVALCQIEKQDNGNSNVIFCGANRPFIYYLHEAKELKYQRGTLATIGGLEGQRFNEEFENIEIELKPKDMIYLTSDAEVFCVCFDGSGKEDSRGSGVDDTDVGSDKGVRVHDSPKGSAIVFLIDEDGGRSRNDS